jgi:hypothetical protein
MRYLVFVLALIGGISAATVPVTDATAGHPTCHHHQGGDDNFQGNEDCQ